MTRFSLRMLLPFMLIAALALPASRALAQDAPAGFKIGVVDMQQVLSEYQKRQSKYASLQAEVESRQKAIDGLSSQIESLKADYENTSKTITEDERYQKRKKIEDLYADYRSKLEENQREIDRQEELVLKEVFSDVERVLQTIGAAQNYHLILNGRNSPRGTVLWSSPTIDLTPTVLAELNAGGASSAASAPAAAPAKEGKKGKK